MKKHLLLFAFTLLTVGALNAQIYMSENFNSAGTDIPSGWSFTTADATSDGWLRNTSALLSSASWVYPNNDTKILSTNDDACDCNKSADRIIMPSVDLSTAVVPFLVFDKYYRAGTYLGATENAKLEVSTDGGTIWTTLQTIPGDAPALGWQTVAYALSAYVGQTNVMLSILYNDGGGWVWGFGIDNLSVMEQPTGLNMAVTNLTAAPVISAIPAMYPATIVPVGRDIFFIVGLSNLQGTIVTSCTVTVSNGTTSVSQDFTDLTLNWLGSASVTLNNSIPAASGTNNYSVTISNINGGPDEISTDNTASSIAISGVTLHPDKAVLVEEATGTWCGWCVRGTIMMDYMTEMYPDNFIGITVHNGDPMVLAAYDTWIGGQIGGYPSILVDRDGSEYDPLDMENMTVELASQAPAATVAVSHSLSGNQLTINVSATYNQNLNGDYRFNVVLIEDHLSGTASGWNQTNYYANNAYGAMGGYESMPASVTELFYDHVGRALLGGTLGTASSLPASGTAGSTYTYSYTVTVDPTWNLAYLRPVAMVLNNTTKKVVNAKRSAIAIAVNEEPTLDNSLIVYPNPSNGVINIQANMTNASKANVRIYTSTGELVLNQNIQDIRFSNMLDLQAYGSGLYTIVIDSEGFSATRRVTVMK